MSAEPEVVKPGDSYLVRLEAACDCSAFLFAVDSLEEEIWLLHPNDIDPPIQLPGEAIIPPLGGVFRADAAARSSRRTEYDSCLLSATSNCCINASS